MEKIDIVKMGVGSIVGIGTGIIVGTAITTVAPAAIGAGILVRICTRAGAMAIEGMLVDKVCEFTGKKIDMVHKQFTVTKERIKEDLKNVKNEKKIVYRSFTTGEPTET